MLQRLSVVIPSKFNKNRVYHLTRLIKVLCNSKYVGDIVLVIPSFANEKQLCNNKRILKTCKKLNIIKQRGNGVADARNCGLSNAKENIILFVDDDCLVHRDLPKKIIEDFHNYSIDGLFGVSYPYKNKSSFGGYWKHIKKVMPTRWGGGRCMAFYKKALLKVNGFDNVISSEDVDIGLKLTANKYKLIVDPKIYVFHIERDTLLDKIKERVWYGKGKAQIWELRKKLNAPLSLFTSVLLLPDLVVIIFVGFFNLFLFLLLLLFSMTFFYVDTLRKYRFNLINLPKVILELPILYLSQDVGFFYQLIKDTIKIKKHRNFLKL